MSRKSDTRKRVWATIVYPESAPSNWLDILKDFKVQALISPLHDKDVWTAQDQEDDPTHLKGTPKKPHYHVELLFDGKKSFEQVYKMCVDFGGVFPIPCESKSGMAAYLTHEFEDDKYHYDKNEIICINGASYNAIVAESADYKNIIIAEMLDWCDENNIYSYAQLLRYARHEKPDWFNVLNHSSTNQMMAFLKSKAWEDKLTNTQ